MKKSVCLIIMVIVILLVMLVCVGKNVNDIYEHIAPENWKGVNWFNYLPIHSPIVYPTDTWLGRNNLLPWWNSTRYTRNSSWDIRGDVRPTIYYTGAWHNSPHIGYRHYT